MFGARTNGIYQQQDAQEFLSYLLNALSAVFPTHHKSMDSNLVKDLFQITYRCSYECPESGETLETEETGDTLYCNIRGGPNDEEKVNFMFQVGVSSSVFRRESSWVSRARWRSTPKRSVAARRGKNT